MNFDVVRTASRRLASPLGSRELDLDVVRGVAILLAVGWHLAGKPTGNPISDTLLLPARTFGWAGVDLFFVLSGFLVGRLIFREQVRTGGFDAKRFLIRRAFKLWPVSYLFIAYLMLTHLGDPWQYLPLVFHVQNYAQASPPHLWSLAVEEHFYLALALLLPLGFRRGLRPSAIVRIAFGVMAVCLIARVVAVNYGVEFVLVQQLTHFRVDSLLAGVLLAVASVYYTDVFDRVVTFKWLWFGGTVLGGLWLWTFAKTSEAGATFGYSIAYLGSASFMMLLYRASWVVRFRAVLRPIGTLGIYSYAIYLTHVSAAGYVNRAVVRFAPWINETPLRLAVLFAGIVAIAVVVTRLVEWPALKLRDRIFPPQAHAVRQAPAEESTQPSAVPHPEDEPVRPQPDRPAGALEGPTQVLPVVPRQRVALDDQPVDRLQH